MNSDYSIWVDSKSYNIVESIHTIYLTLIIDLFIGKTIYSVNQFLIFSEIFDIVSFAFMNEEVQAGEIEFKI